MHTVQAKDAKADFAALLEAAERGEPTIITRQGKPAAVLVPVDDARRIYADDKPSFLTFLRSYPGGIDLGRDPSPLRDANL